MTLAPETMAFLKVYAFPSGVSGTAVALVPSLLAFFVVSWLTRRDAASQLEPDVALVMEV